MPTTLKLEGFEQLSAQLLALSSDLTDGTAPLQRSMAESAVEDLRASLPLGQTGRLRASVSSQSLSTHSPARVATVVIVGAPYARMVEFGTARTPTRPTFVPLMRRTRLAFLRAVLAQVRAIGLTITGEPGDA